MSEQANAAQEDGSSEGSAKPKADDFSARASTTGVDNYVLEDDSDEHTEAQASENNIGRSVLFFASHVPPPERTREPGHGTLRKESEAFKQESEVLWQESEDVLTSWHESARAFVYAHHAAEYYHSSFNLVLGLCAIAITELIAIDPSNTILPSILGLKWHAILGSVVAGLVSLQTFLKENQQAEKHLIAANKYSAIRREIEEIGGQPAFTRANMKGVLDEIRMMFDRAADDSPPVGRWFWSFGSRRAKSDNSRHPFPKRRAARQPK